MFSKVQLVGLVGLLGVCSLAEGRVIMPPRIFSFKIAPDAPFRELLPEPPPAPADIPLLRNDDPAKMREVMFGAPLYADGKIDALKEVAYAHAKINHLNKNKRDGYMEALLAARPDLRGLPFRMGDDCRMSEEQADAFKVIV